MRKNFLRLLFFVPYNLVHIFLFSTYEVKRWWKKMKASHNNGSGKILFSSSVFQVRNYSIVERGNKDVYLSRTKNLFTTPTL